MTRPGGTLVAVSDDAAALRRAVSAVAEARCVEVVTTTREAAKAYVDALGERARVLDAREADDANGARRIGDADVVCLAGGRELVAALRDTRALRAIRDRYAAGGVVAGGEAVGGATLDGDDALALLPGAVVSGRVLDGSFGRLVAAASRRPHLVGLGLGEGTALLVREGRRVEAIGEDNVVVVDGRGDPHAQGEEAAHERVVLHTLSEGYGFDLETRRFTGPKPVAPSMEKVSA